MSRVARLLAIAAALAAASGALLHAQPLSAPLDSAAPAQSAAPPQPPPIPYPTTLAPPASAICDAQSLAWLVGKPRSAIPVPVYPSLRRVYCSSCLVTQDYMPGRTDIVYDTETGIITAVKCG